MGVTAILQSLSFNDSGVSAPRQFCAPRSVTVSPDAIAYLAGSTPGSRIAALIGDFAITRRYRKPGDYLFRAGAAFHFFYVLNAGFAKSCYVSEDGRERTTGVHFRGDILGLDGVATGSYGCDAVALNTCEVLAIPYETILARCQNNADLVHELHRAFSAEMRKDRDLMLSMSNLSADGRVASFLLDISVRSASRGFSATQLQLHLTRQEIGSMLGLQLETVSRAFSHFARLGLITVCLREIVLLNRQGLLDLIALTAEMERESKKLSSGNFVCKPAGPARAGSAAGCVG